MKKYYHTLNKDSQKKIKEIYKSEYINTSLNARLSRLNLYAIIGYVSAIMILILSIKTEDSIIGSVIISITLVLVSTIFLIGSYLIKLKVLNKIALKNK